jgi:hypothetical protein
MNINILKKKLEIKYYNALIKTLKNNNMNYDRLNDIVLKLNENIMETIDETEEVPVTNEKPLQIFTDDTLYKKPWNKLNSIHKILKIKEFVNSLNIKSPQEKESLKDELVNLIKLKVLTKKETINYDEDNGKINSLINLQYKNGKYIYLVE